MMLLPRHWHVLQLANCREDELDELDESTQLMEIMELTRNFGRTVGLGRTDSAGHRLSSGSPQKTDYFRNT